MFKPFKYIALFFLFLGLAGCGSQTSTTAQSTTPTPTTTPVLRFSDLISGPSIGLGDGKGSGVIVTLWGQLLGQGKISSAATINSNYKVFFTDSSGVKRQAAYIYYWKNADGKLPSGPANLYESHRMQEIAFSIPNSAMGLGKITVSVNGVVSNPLPFTVRAGKIFHVKSGGNDITGDGSWLNPWQTVAKAQSLMKLGTIVYLHDMIVGGATKRWAIYNNSGLKADTSNQLAYVAYPGSKVKLLGSNGVWMFRTTGIVTSKLSVYASNCDSVGANCLRKDSTGIAPSDWGRVIGNSITDQPNGCANSQSGAISGGVGRVEGAKIFGNYIHDYACPETSKFHHTTYMTIRAGTADPSIKPWEFGWNYLKNNHAKNGIHNYDKDTSGFETCGDLNANLKIHDNVIVNQAGAGISIISECGWTQDTYIYDNVLINVGLMSDVNCPFNCGPNGAAFTLGDSNYYGNIYLFNNTVYLWDQDNIPGTGTSAACASVIGAGDNIGIFFNDNVCFNNKESYFIGSGLRAGNKLNNFKGNHNVWYSPFAVSAIAIPPAWDASKITADPLMTVKGSQIVIGKGSPVIGKSKTTLKRDIYGQIRGRNSNIGAIQTP